MIIILLRMKHFSLYRLYTAWFTCKYS